MTHVKEPCNLYYPGHMTKYKTSLLETMGRTNGQRCPTEDTLVVTEFKCVSEITKEAGFNDSEIQCVSLVTDKV